MAPLPANNTNRLFVRQVGAAGVHETVMRFPSNVSQQDAVTRARVLCLALAPMISNTVSFAGARWQVAGTKLSFPVNWGAAITGTNATLISAENKPRFVSATGRSTGGRRVRMTFFGVTVGVTPDYRVIPEEGAAVNAFLDELHVGTPGPCAIDGLLPLWNDYLNAGYNAYFQRRNRRTS